MPVIYDDSKKIFHLQSGNSSYVMQVVKDKYLAHLYWGERLSAYHGSRAIIWKDRGFAPNPDDKDRTFSLDTLPQEYPQTGNGDFRNCAYGIRQKNGSRISSLFYKGYEIQEGKPELEGLPASFAKKEEAQTLKIFLEDAVAGLEVCLLYTVWHDRDVITRSVQFKNHSDSEIILTKMLSMSLDIRESEFDVMTLYGAHNNERNIDRRPLTSGTVQIESLRGTSSPHQSPFMALLRKETNEDYGEVFAANFVYSGNFTASAQVDPYRNTRFQMGMNPWNGEWVLKPEKTFGYMWECPDLFEIGGQQIMTCCPQGVEQKGYDYQNVYQCGYFPVNFDLVNKKYVFGTFVEFDKGFDIYATQTFQDEQGRRILIGWMGIPDADYDNDATVQYDWIHALTMPRELSFKDGMLLQKPLKEMQELRKNEFHCALSEFTQWEPEDSCFELHIDFEEKAEKVEIVEIERGQQSRSMKLQLREDVILSLEEGILRLNMGKSGRGRKERAAKVEKLRNLTIFSDTSAIEIFINDGEIVMTTRVYSENLKQKVTFLSKENTGSVIGYELGSFIIHHHEEV